MSKKLKVVKTDSNFNIYLFDSAKNVWLSCLIIAKKIRYTVREIVFVFHALAVYFNSWSLYTNAKYGTQVQHVLLYLHCFSKMYNTQIYLVLRLSLLLKLKS